ncbi:hypothetical protein T261_2214 [Streptomyces lydicus]|nr:hypothetical protein T261_2214 [Streptomyces lydicus]
MLHDAMTLSPNTSIGRWPILEPLTGLWIATDNTWYLDEEDDGGQE